MKGSKVRVGIIGTSWWADSMYLPALAEHDLGVVGAVSGRSPSRTEDFARRWGIDRWYTDPLAMIHSDEVDAVIVASANDGHHPMSAAALDAGLHVLCEKPLGLDVTEAADLVARARSAGAITMVPFTYRYMPMFRWMKRLIAEGYVGSVRHVNLRYYTGFAHGGEYLWRFDRAVAGSGVLGDLGSHWIHVARWLLADDEMAVSASTHRQVPRADRPDGTDYERAEDSAVFTVDYRSGAYGVFHVTAVAWEPGTFGQNHQIEVHGDDGTLHGRCDWQTVQMVSGARWGEGPIAELPIPDEIWNGAPRDSVHDTYRHIFRRTDAMTRGWVDAVAAGTAIVPDFAEGLAVQRVLDAALASAEDGGRRQSIGTRT